MKKYLTGFSLIICHSALNPAMAQSFQQEFGNPRKAFVETIATPDHADSHYRLGGLERNNSAEGERRHAVERSLAFPQQPGEVLEVDVRENEERESWNVK